MNMATATAALYETFGVAKHKIFSTGEDGNQTKHQHVQQVIVGILHCVKEGHQRSKEMDWMDVCMVVACTGDIENPDCAHCGGESTKSTSGLNGRSSPSRKFMRGNTQLTSGSLMAIVLRALFL
jgi:hypothetical protein